jgi:hypothetical protein
MKIVCQGTWLYDNLVKREVDVVALDFDWWHELAKANGQLDDSEQAKTLGPAGYLYYARFSNAGINRSNTSVDTEGHETVQGAQAAAQAKAPSEIVWQLCE